MTSVLLLHFLDWAHLLHPLSKSCHGSSKCCSQCSWNLPVASQLLPAASPPLTSSQGYSRPCARACLSPALWEMHEICGQWQRERSFPATREVLGIGCREPRLQPHHPAAWGFLFSSRQCPFLAPPRWAYLPAPSIYLGWGQFSKGEQSPTHRRTFLLHSRNHSQGHARALQNLTVGEGDSLQGRPQLSTRKIQLNGITVLFFFFQIPWFN